MAPKHTHDVKVETTNLHFTSCRFSVQRMPCSLQHRAWTVWIPQRNACLPIYQGMPVCHDSSLYRHDHDLDGAGECTETLTFV